MHAAFKMRKLRFGESQTCPVMHSFVTRVYRALAVGKAQGNMLGSCQRAHELAVCLGRPMCTPKKQGKPGSRSWQEDLGLIRPEGDGRS